MKEFSELINRLLLTSSRNRKIDILSNYFQNTSDPDRGYTLAILTNGLELRNIPISKIKEIVFENIDHELFTLSYDYVGDLAETISLIWPHKKIGSLLSISEIIALLRNLKKDEISITIKEFLSIANETQRWALIKLISGGLRIGVSSRLAKTALAKFSNKKLDDIEKIWHGIEPPYDNLFKWLSNKGPIPEIDLLKTFNPMMLANPITKTDFENLSSNQFIAEWKWDGIRIQLVSLNQSVKLYSRTGDDISKTFPEITSLKLKQNFSLDGELMAGEINRPGTFNDLQQRLNRKSPSKEIIKTVPTFIIAYDILFLKSSDIRQNKITERRKILSQFLNKENLPFIKFSEEVKFKDFNELEQKRLKCREELNYEGLMLKLKNSIYQPGRPKGPWYKFKRDPFNVDVVLLYAQRGHGKRSSLYSDYTFGVWQKSSLKEDLVTVGKAYSGFTDKELIKLDKFIRTKTINKFGPVREVEKSLVLEVSFDDIQNSKRHKSGLAMRFPRIKRIRWDKPANEADTLENLKKLVN